MMVRLGGSHRSTVSWSRSTWLASATVPLCCAVSPVGGAVLEGQVLNNTGGGVHGADVVVTASADGGKPGKAIVQGKTNKTGDFKLQLPAGTPSKIEVRIRAEGFEDFVREVDLREEPEPFLVGELTGSLSISGRITRGPNGPPAVGAEVIYRSVADVTKVAVDAEGRYKLAPLQKGNARLEIVAEGFAKEELEVRLDKNKTIDLALRKEYRVDIIVVDDRGKPYPGVTVEAFSHEPQRSYSGLTDEDGRCRLRGVHPDTGRLQARLLTEKHITPQGWKRIIPLPDGQDTVKRRFVLPRPTRLKGRVLRARDEKPMPLARVAIGEDKGELVMMTNTDRRGRFELAGLPPGQTVVTAQHPETGPALEVIKLTPAGTDSIELKLPPGAPLRGVVKDTQGRPVPDARILTDSWRGHKSLAMDARTDPKGRFVLKHAPRDGVMLLVQAKGYSPYISELLKPGQKMHSLVLRPTDAPPPGLEKDETLPPELVRLLYSAKTLDGETLDAGTVAERYIFLDFWATWCPPCRAEIPHVKAVAAKLGKRDDFLIIGISLDRDEETLRQFVKDNEMTWPQLFGKAGRTEEIARAFGVQAIPTTLLISPERRVLARNLRGKGLHLRIAKLITQAKAAEQKLKRPDF